MSYCCTCRNDSPGIAYSKSSKSSRVSAAHTSATGRASSERQAARLDNHDQRLRAMEHRLMLMEIEFRELCDAVKGANGV